MKPGMGNLPALLHTDHTAAVPQWEVGGGVSSAGAQKRHTFTHTDH